MTLLYNVHDDHGDHGYKDDHDGYLDHDDHHDPESHRSYDDIGYHDDHLDHDEYFGHDVYLDHDALCRIDLSGLQVRSIWKLILETKHHACNEQKNAQTFFEPEQVQMAQRIHYQMIYTPFEIACN